MDAGYSLRRANYQAATLKPETFSDELLGKLKGMQTETKKWSHDADGALTLDLLSIHIDSFDWHLVRAAIMENKVRPRVILVQTLDGYFYGSRR